MIYVVTDSRRTYRGIVERLEQAVGAQLLELAPGEASGAIPAITSKSRQVRRLVSPTLLRLRHRWSSDDVVLTISWYVLPVLALMRLRVLARPRRLVSMATFVQSPAARRAVNMLLKLTMIPELEFIVLTPGEQRNLIESVGVPADRIHKVILPGKLEPEVEVAEGDPPYVFTGGYTNRDYDTFFKAVEPLPYPVVVVASGLNRLSELPSNAELRLDLPWPEFERVLAACHLVVVPLRGIGEASGQSVLHRGMRYLRPVVATRHDGLIEHLGEDYAGFVPADDAEALRDAIDRGMSDESFRRTLIGQISERRDLLRRRGDAASVVLSILQPRPQ